MKIDGGWFHITWQEKQGLLLKTETRLKLTIVITLLLNLMIIFQLHDQFV